MAETGRSGLDGQLMTSKTVIKWPLTLDDFPNFAESERASLAYIVTGILSGPYSESSVSGRLREAVAKNCKEPSHKTRHDIRDLILEQFFRREPQHKLSSPLMADSNAGVSMAKESVKRVFRTPELLEGILVNLSMTDLVITSRVNKQFRNVIKSSPILQSKLFLRPVAPTASIELSFRHPHSQPPVRGPRKYIMAECNPLLRTNDDPTIETLWSQPRDLTQRMSPEVHGDTVRFNERMLLAGCWTTMYLTNPPCIEARIRLVYTAQHSGVVVWISADCTICCESGITLGMVMEAAHSKGPVRTMKMVPGSSPLFDISYATLTTVTDEVRKYETEHQDFKMELCLKITHIQAVGLALPSEEEVHKWKKGQRMVIRRYGGGDYVDAKYERGNDLSDIAQRAMRVDDSWDCSPSSST